MRLIASILFGISLALPVASVAADVDTAADNTPGGATRVEPSLAGEIGDVVMYALSLNGASYKFGGESPETGFDCSGFVSYVFRNAAGLSLPHNALAISRAGEKITLANLQPGDLVFFKTLRKAFSHVGIYLGDNRFIHSSSASSGSVMISDMTEQYWATRFTGARRIDLPE
jgi:cell wall-associated NlpC family hydrolase